MRARTPWLVLPDGKYAQLGDTHLINAPAWVADHPEPEGLWFARLAGLAAVATPGERLLAVAWYHVRGHKHADELSFVWYARGTRLLVDAGCYGYYYDEPGRKYAESSRSHNVLTRADREFSFRGQPAYGSGLLGAGSGAGWYAIIGHNPLLAAQEVAHRRLWLFRPGELLYVVDLVENRADERPQLRRRFHFGPEVEASHLGDSTWRLAVGDRVVGRMCELSGEGVTFRAVRGQREPEPLGVTFPSTRTWSENWTLELDSPADLPVLVVAFALGEAPAQPSLQWVENADRTFDVALGDEEAPFFLRVGPIAADGSLRVVAR